MGGERRREGKPRTKDKECRSQKVTRISFDEITWRLRVGTVIAFVVYRQEVAGSGDLPSSSTVHYIFRGIERTAPLVA